MPFSSIVVGLGRSWPSVLEKDSAVKSAQYWLDIRRSLGRLHCALDFCMAMKSYSIILNCLCIPRLEYMSRLALMPLFFQFKLQANMEALSVLIMAIISVLRVNTNVTSFILANVIRLPLDSSGWLLLDSLSLLCWSYSHDLPLPLLERWNHFVWQGRGRVMAIAIPWPDPHHSLHKIIVSGVWCRTESRACSCQNMSHRETYRSDSLSYAAKPPVCRTLKITVGSKACFLSELRAPQLQNLRRKYDRSHSTVLSSKPRTSFIWAIFNSPRKRWRNNICIPQHLVACNLAAIASRMGLTYRFILLDSSDFVCCCYKSSCKYCPGSSCSEWTFQPSHMLWICPVS